MSGNIYITVQSSVNRAAFVRGAAEMKFVQNYSHAVAELRNTARSRPFFDLNEVRAFNEILKNFGAIAMGIAQQCAFRETQAAIYQQWILVAEVVMFVENRRWKGPFAKRVRSIIVEMSTFVLYVEDFIKKQ